MKSLRPIPGNQGRMARSLVHQGPRSIWPPLNFVQFHVATNLISGKNNPALSSQYVAVLGWTDPRTTAAQLRGTTASQSVTRPSARIFSSPACTQRNPRSTLPFRSAIKVIFPSPPVKWSPRRLSNIMRVVNRGGGWTRTGNKTQNDTGERCRHPVQR